MEAVKKYIYEQVAAQKLSIDDARTMLKELHAGMSKPEEDIAVIGMACKFPKAENLDEYWENLRSGLECIGEFPPGRRKDTDILFPDAPGPEEDLYIPQGYLDEIDKFDAAFFNLSPREAGIMEPAQRLFLETVWEAIEDAGLEGKRIYGSKTGVFAGKAHMSEVLYREFMNSFDPSAYTGVITGAITGRVSYILDLKKPSMVVDTACSSGLVAVHLACRSLKNNECEMAIAGGVNLSLFPTRENRLEMLEAPDGILRPFDGKANGTTWGEGVGVVVLKPLSKAIAHRDNIYAVIKGSACNSDGASGGMTAPNVEAQEELLVTAWENAKINPGTIGYIETHGTGTPMGDPIEVKSLSNAFKRYTDKKQFCGIGSVKGNIGHLMAASGMASLIKTVLALKHGEMPSSVRFEEPNRYIGFCDSPVFVNRRLRKWQKGDSPRRAGISSFGLSGTNCHVVLEEAPEVEKHREETGERLHVLVLSAKSEGALKELAAKYRRFVDEKGAQLDIGDLCYTAGNGRDHYGFRLAMIIKNRNDLKEKLDGFVPGIPEEDGIQGIFSGRHKIVAESRRSEGREEITEQQKRALSEAANARLRELTETGKRDAEALTELCRLYVRGADVCWEELYREEKVWTVSLPLYPFERKRCWVETNKEKELFYASGWAPEELEDKMDHGPGGSVLVLKGPGKTSGEIIGQLRQQGRTVIEVETGEAFARAGEDSYCIGGTEEDYKYLISEVKDRGISQIIHLLTMTDEEVTDVQGLEESQKRGVYSLFYLTRAILENGIGKDLDMVIISNCAHEVTGEEDRLHPENATLFGLGKVIGREYPQVRCRCIDMDGVTPVEKIILQLRTTDQTYQVAYRKGSRYVDEFKAMDMKQVPGGKLQIREDGVYILTGGLGGIGLAMAKHLASKARVKLAMINRSLMPDRSTWKQILEKGDDKKTCDKIRAVMEIEEAGAEVICCNADVAQPEPMKAVIDGLREKYGRINGVIHSAGIPGYGFIASQEERELRETLSPKVQGTWILDRLTEKDDLDFFVSFASAAAVFWAQGMGGYTAANAYLDSFAAYRRRQGKRTLTIDWVIWKETGMAADGGINDDVIFKAIPTGEAVSAFDEVLGKDLSRIFIGEINYESKIVYLMETYPIKLSSGISARIRKYGARKGNTGEGRARLGRSGTGSDGLAELDWEALEGYSEIEAKLACAWQEVLGTEQVGLDEIFFELGGDSIKALQVSTRLRRFGLSIETKALLQYPTIRELSAHVKRVTREADQGIAKGELALTPVQKYFFEQHSTGLHHYNEAVMLYRRKGFDEALVRKAFGKIVEHHDALRIVFKMEEGRVMPYNRGLEGELFSLEVVQGNDTGIIGETAARLQAGMNLQEGPLVKLALFKTPEGDHLLVVIHHLVVDGLSWRILLEDFGEGYLQADAGGGIKFQPKTDSFKEWSRSLGAYADSKDLLKEISYWESVESISAAPLPRDSRIDENRVKDERTVPVALPEEETEKLLKQVNKAYNTEINDILLTALGMAVKSWTGQDRVLISLEGHGREPVIEEMDIARTVGWFTAIYPVVLDMSGPEELSSRIKNVKEYLRHIPQKGMGYGILKYLTSHENKKAMVFNQKPEIRFNYLGQFDTGSDGRVFQMSPLPVGRKVSPDSERQVVFDINGMITGGRLVMNFCYNRNEYTEETVQRFSGYFKKHLLDIICHCTQKENTEITPTDLGDKELSMEELDDISEMFEGF